MEDQIRYIYSYPDGSGCFATEKEFKVYWSKRAKVMGEDEFIERFENEDLQDGLINLEDLIKEQKPYYEFGPPVEEGEIMGAKTAYRDPRF